MLTAYFYNFISWLLNLGAEWLPDWDFPSGLYSAIDTLITTIYRLDLLFPTWTLVKAMMTVLGFLLVKRIWNFMSSLAGFVRGTDNPKI